MQETWVGQAFGKLKVISYEEKGRKKICHCKCSCGNPKTLEIPP
ncbi:hypothetical protein [Cytobacillus oceanisediminis]|nr:hypothetical protein [Cytobacillus oceanisediminis]